MFVRSFFVCTKAKRIVAHSAEFESDCRDASVLKTWIPVLAERENGYDPLDFIGGYISEEWDSSAPLVADCCFDSVNQASDYFEFQCDHLTTNYGVSFISVLDICKTKHVALAA